METISVSFPYVSFSKCARYAVPNSQMHISRSLLHFLSTLLYICPLATSHCNSFLFFYFNPSCSCSLTHHFLPFIACVHALSAHFSSCSSSFHSLIVAVSQRVCIRGFVHPVLHFYIFQAFVSKRNFW